MERKSYLGLASAVFGIVALLHLWRAVGNLPLIVGPYELPVWLSYVAVVFTGFMSITAYKLAKK